MAAKFLGQLAGLWRPLRTSSTICWRNPAEYGGFVLGISDSSFLFDSVREMGQFHILDLNAPKKPPAHSGPIRPLRSVCVALAVSVVKAGWGWMESVQALKAGLF